MGVGWWSKKKPYMLYVVGVGSPTPFPEAESFSYRLCTPTCFKTPMKKSMGVGTTMTYRRGVYYIKTMGV